jgi:hypothetical protein
MIINCGNVVLFSLFLSPRPTAGPPPDYTGCPEASGILSDIRPQFAAP